MSTTTLEFRTLPGSRAAVGRSGAHTVIADRPVGKAGGLGLGFNGGELLAFAMGGCLCNDLQAIAEEMGVEIDALNVSVSIDFDGVPSRATDARIEIWCELADGSDPAELIERAKRLTTIGNSSGPAFLWKFPKPDKALGASTLACHARRLQRLANSKGSPAAS